MSSFSLDSSPRVALDPEAVRFTNADFALALVDEAVVGAAEGEVDALSACVPLARGRELIPLLERHLQSEHSWLSLVKTPRSFLSSGDGGCVCAAVRRSRGSDRIQLRMALLR